MQTRFDAHYIDLLALNFDAYEEDSFLLYNLLNQEHSSYISAEKQIKLDDEKIQLSHSLTYVDSDDGKTPYYKLGNNQGRLYLLATGVCYHDFPHSRPGAVAPTLNDLDEQVKCLYDLEFKLSHSEAQFSTPIYSDIADIENDIAALKNEDEQSERICKQEVLSLAHRIAFYTAHLKKISQWKSSTINTGLFNDAILRPLFVNYLLTAQDINYFSKMYNYPFQGHQLRFTHSFVRRNRPKKKDKCFDILEKRALGSSDIEESGVFKVIALFDPMQRKMQPKHPRVYKVDSTKPLEGEYNKTKRLAPYLCLRNYQPGLFSERYLGIDLFEYVNDTVVPFRKNVKTVPEYIERMLKISYRSFEALAEVMKEEVHGDIKPENFLVEIEKDDFIIRLIDFEGKNRHTPIYASPERLLRLPTTPKSDVYSLARSLVFLWGDRHTLWDFIDPTSENCEKIRNIILTSSIETLLKRFDAGLRKFHSASHLSSDMHQRLTQLFSRAHAIRPQDRPSALELAQEFKGLYLEYRDSKTKHLNMKVAL